MFDFSDKLILRQADCVKLAQRDEYGAKAMLNKKIIIFALALTTCVGALLTSCGMNGGTSERPENESAIETTKKPSGSGAVGEVGSEVGDVAGDIIDGAGDIVSDVADGGDREEATHGTEAEKDSEKNAKHRQIPYGK